MVRRDASAIGAYALLALALTWPLAANFTRAVPGLDGDNWQQYWNVWWVKRALLELHQSPYHTPELFHPGGADLHLHALNLAPVLLVLPLAAAFGVTVAYNVMALLSFVFAGHGAYRLCLSATVRRSPRHAPAPVHLAAFLGGAVFTFSAYHFFYWQGPMALASVQWLPYFVWQLKETHAHGGARAPLLAGVFFVCAAVSDWFLALALLLFTLAFTAWHGSRPALRRLALAMGGAGLLLAPVLGPALAAARAAGRPYGAAETAARLSGDLLGFFVPSPLHPLWQGRWVPVYRGLAGGGAVTTFLGFVPLVLAVVAARRVGKRVRFWLVAALLFGVLTLGPGLHVAGRALPLPLPAALFYRLPFLDLLRSPGRFVVLVSLCLAVVSAAGVIALWRRARWRRRAGGLVAALSALSLFENLAAPYPLASTDVPSVYHAMALERGRGALLELPLDGVFPERMLHQTRHGKPVLGGYLARGEPPTAWDRLPGFRELRVLQPEVPDVVAIEDRASAARAVLARHGVDTIVIDKGRAAGGGIGPSPPAGAGAPSRRPPAGRRSGGARVSPARAGLRLNVVPAPGHGRRMAAARARRRPRARVPAALPLDGRARSARPARGRLRPLANRPARLGLPPAASPRALRRRRAGGRGDGERAAGPPGLRPVLVRAGLAPPRAAQPGRSGARGQ